jgi:hypothetical protein
MEFDCLGLCLHEQWAGYVSYKAGGDRDVGDVHHPDLIRPSTILLQRSARAVVVDRASDLLD